MSRGRKVGKKKIPQSWQEIYLKNVGFYFSNLIFELGRINEIGEESAIELMNQINSEKEKLGIKEKIFPLIKPEEIPFKIPENWVWCRLGEMSVNLDGARKPISQSDRENRKKFYDYYGASGIIDKIDGYTHEGELLLIGEDGANLVSRSTPVAFIATGKFWVNNHAHVLNTIHRITLDYLCFYINSIDLKPFISGGFQPKLSQGNLNLIPIPLPPLVEQEKIISFLNNFEEENFSKDQFYFDRRIEQVIFDLHKDQILGSELKGELSFQLTQLENLNQAILQEAVQGKLVPQDAKDEPASELLKRIKIEKANSGKKEKPLPPIKPDEIPFAIPVNWVWCRLGDICSKITDGFHNTPPKISNGFPYIAATQVKPDKIDWDNCHYVSEKYHRELYLKTTPQKGEILVVNIGAGCGTPAIIDVDFEFSFKNTAILKFDQSEIFNKYVFYYFLLKRDDFYKDLTKGGLQPFLSLKILNNIIFPLAPRSEQKRIVAEMEKQFTKTKQLKEHIIANQQATEQLLKALLHQAFEVEEMEKV